MKNIDLQEATRKLFARHRPDDAYAEEEVHEQFRRWKAKALWYKRGEICLKAGSPAKEFLVVVEGALHLRMHSLIGDDILARIVLPGEYVGLPLIYTHDVTHLYDAMAATDTEVVVFKVDEVRKWRKDPRSQPLFDYIGQLMSRIILDSQQRVMILSGKDIAERLCRYLAMRMERDGKRTIAIPGTASDFADYLGVNKCALSRAIGRLRDEGKIEFKRNVFTVLKSV